MRISWGKTLVVAIIAAIAVVVFVIKPGQDDQDAAPAATSAPVTSSPSAATSSSTSPAPAETLPSEVQAFVDAYASSEGDDAQWLEQLRPYVTPALFASLSSSSRDLGRGAGTQILDADDGRVAVGSSAGASYTLAYEQVDVDEDEDAATGGQTVITGIDFADPPAGAALPMDTTGGEQFRGPVQDALRVVVAQPGGWTDADREAAIRQAFTAPEAVLTIPRTAPEDIPIKIGNAHELTPANENGQLVVYATVPYAVDGTTDASWATVTVVLARSGDGKWSPLDAHL